MVEKKEQDESNINPKKQVRYITIETDGNSINIKESTLSGRLELIQMLEELIIWIKTPKPESK